MLQKLPCPYCEGVAMQMPVLSDISFVDFFQCTSCGRIVEAAKVAEASGVPTSPGLLTDVTAGQQPHRQL
jgi:hypothetical protein